MAHFKKSTKGMDQACSQFKEGGLPLSVTEGICIQTQNSQGTQRLGGGLHQAPGWGNGMSPPRPLCPLWIWSQCCPWDHAVLKSPTKKAGKGEGEILEGGEQKLRES